MATLKITQIRSTIGTKPKQRGTLRALGLKRINHTVELPDRPEIRGMVNKVPHLVTVEAGDERPGRSASEETPPAASTKGGGA